MTAQAAQTVPGQVRELAQAQVQIQVSEYGWMRPMAVQGVQLPMSPSFALLSLLMLLLAAAGPFAMKSRKRKKRREAAAACFPTATPS